MQEAAAAELARTIRCELLVLLPSGDADLLARLDGELGRLIARSDAGEPVAIELLRLLRGYPGLQRRANELAERAPERGVVAPPGDIRVPLGPRYVCPNGDFEFFRRDASQPVPVCPHDGAVLVPGASA